MFEDDQDSLFGSPPPSPIRGRSPALPTQVAQEKGGGVIQNVGTIALPGSHMSCSELPAILPAQPSGGLDTHEPLRSCVLPPQNTSQWHSAQPSRAPLSAPSLSRSPSISCPSSNATRKRKSAKSKSSTPRPEPPPIMFPGPDDPVPSNFLRSQKALLGIAGLVGDVKPTSLPLQTQQGSTPSNPIIIEESSSTPFMRSHPPRIDTTQLPSVDREDVISSLIKQNNIFPVLSSILKLLGSSPDPPPHPPATHTLSFSRPHGVRPLKRRRLTSVPAGAVDWDVPYPFPEGEGPEAYHATWERERARHLMLQLLELIRGAMQGAAVKKPSRKEGMEAKKMKLGERDTDHQGSVNQESSVSTDDSRSSTVEPIPEEFLSGSIESSADSLDEFLASFFPSVPSRPQDPLKLGETPQFDEALFDNWLAELQAIPPPESPDITTPLTSVPSLDDLIRSHSSSPATSTPPIQTTQKPNPVALRRASCRSIDKESILQRTRERRRQIVAEIERAKVELWETSIEGGVLGNLVKDPTLS